MPLLLPGNIRSCSRAVLRPIGRCRDRNGHTEQSHPERTHSYYTPHMCMPDKRLGPEVMKAGRLGEKIPSRNGLKANNQ